jgi:hypothetical protein
MFAVGLSRHSKEITTCCWSRKSLRTIIQRPADANEDALWIFRIRMRN